MERKKASDYPQELLDLFDHYVHGEIVSRRAEPSLMVRAEVRCRVVSLPWLFWESLRLNYAFAQQVPTH